MRNFKRALALVLAAILVVGTFATVSAAKADEGKWYQDAIDYLHNIGVDSITPSQADMEITREQFVLWIAKIESHQLLDEAWSDKTNFEGKMPVDDIDDANYYAAIAYAFQSGFIKGEDDDKNGVYQFAPDRIITLGEVSAVIVRLMGFEGLMTVDSRVDENWAYNYMRAAQTYCHAFDLTFLENFGYYNPYRTLTYGEAAYIVATIMNNNGNDGSNDPIVTFDGIQLDDYFTDTVNANAVKEENYFVVSIDENGAVLQNVKDREKIENISKADFDKLVRKALNLAENAVLKEEDYPEVGALVTVAKKADTVVSISYEVAKTFTTILNTYVKEPKAPDFYWFEENGNVKLHFDGRDYNINEGDNSDIVFYRNNTKEENKMSVEEAKKALVPTNKGFVYAVFSAAAENVIYTTVVNADGQEIQIIDEVLYDTVVIKDAENFGSVEFEAEIQKTENSLNFVVKVPETITGRGNEIIETFHSADFKIGYLEDVSAHENEGYYLAKIYVPGTQDPYDVKIPMDKEHAEITEFMKNEFTRVDENGKETTFVDAHKYTYNVYDLLTFVHDLNEKAKDSNGIASVTELVALYLNDKCVKFALNKDENMVVSLEIAAPEDDKITTGFVASAVVNGGNNTYDVVIVETNENGVFDVVEYTVRARASSMFNPENYAVYAKIWSNDLINIVDANTNIIPGNEEHVDIYKHDRVEGETDLIYVDVMKDGYSTEEDKDTKYLLCSTGNIKTSISNDWTDIYEGRVLCEIEYVTVPVDSEQDGLIEEEFVYVATIKGYEPYYARTWDADKEIYVYTLKYERVDFATSHKLHSWGLKVALERMSWIFEFSGEQIEGGDITIEADDFLMYDDIPEEEKYKYVEENGWYVFDKEVSFKKGANTIVVPAGAVLQIKPGTEVIYQIDEETGRPVYDHDRVEKVVTDEETLRTVLNNVALNAGSIAEELNKYNVFEVYGVHVDPEQIRIDTVNLYPTIAFGNDNKGDKGVFIDIYENGDVYCVPEGNAHYTKDTEVRFVVPTENGFTVIAKTLDELQGKGVFGVEWNTAVDEKTNAITAIAIITRDVVFGAEGEILDVNTYDVTVDATIPEVKTDDGDDDDDDEKEPTYKVVEFTDYIILENQTVVYFNEKSTYFIYRTIMNGDDTYLDLISVGTTSIDGNDVGEIVYVEIEMTGGEDNFEEAYKELAAEATNARGHYFVIDSDNKIVTNDAVVNANDNLNYNTAEIVTIEGETGIFAKMTEDSDPADGLDEYVDLSDSDYSITFITINNDGDLEVLEDATFEGMTTFDYIAINDTIYVIK